MSTFVGQESNKGTQGCQPAALTTSPPIDIILLQTISRNVFFATWAYSAYQF